MGRGNKKNCIGRRSFLHGGVVGGTTMLAGCSDQITDVWNSSTDDDDRISATETPDKGLSGTVLDINDEPVGGASVTLYDRAADADSVILEATTNSSEDKGKFEFPELGDESVRDRFSDQDGKAALVVQADDWFDTLLIQNLFEQLPVGIDLTLNQELLRGPEFVTDSERDKRLSMLTCWRIIINSDAQTVFIELSDVRDGRGFEPYEIDGHSSDLAGGGFSVTVLGEDVGVNFGSQTNIDGTQPEAVQVLTLNNTSDNPDRVSWHPTRTGLPMYALGRGFTSISTTDIERSNTIDEGVGMIAGGVPGLSTIISWMDALGLAFGERLQYEATLGDIDTGIPDPLDPSSTQKVPDPNTHTTALIGWEADNPAYNLDASAAVAMIPLKFREETTDQTKITVRAEWNQSTGQGTYGEIFQMSNSGSIEPPEKDTPPEKENPDSSAVDGFEDGTVSGWSPAEGLTSAFEASKERSFSGAWSAKFSEGDAKDAPKWENVGDVSKPNKVETAHALQNGEIYSDSFTEWTIGDTIILKINYNWSNNFLAINGSGAEPEDIENGEVVANLPWPSSEGFFHVVLDDIDWEVNEVGEVRVNGTDQAENVPFFNDGNGIDRTTVTIGGDGGNVVFVDETTTPE